jgi:hypothetical protein
METWDLKCFTMCFISCLWNAINLVLIITLVYSLALLWRESYHTITVEFFYKNVCPSIEVDLWNGLKLCSFKFNNLIQSSQNGNTHSYVHKSRWKLFNFTHLYHYRTCLLYSTWHYVWQEGAIFKCVMRSSRTMNMKN